MRKLILALVLALAACGSTAKSGGGYVFNNSDFSSYVSHFETLAQANISPDFKITTTITLSTTPLVDPGYVVPAGHFIAGLCTCDQQTGVKTIALAPDWAHVSPSEQEAIVLHELGHCELYRPHLNSTKADSTPESIMNADGVINEVYIDSSSYYDDELFSVQNKDCSDLAGTTGG